MNSGPGRTDGGAAAVVLAVAAAATVAPAGGHADVRGASAQTLGPRGGGPARGWPNMAGLPVSHPRRA